MQDTSNLTSGKRVLISGFDDVPEHVFVIHTIEVAMSLAWPSQDPSPESTASLTSSWSCGSSHQTAAAGLRELLKP